MSSELKGSAPSDPTPPDRSAASPQDDATAIVVHRPDGALIHADVWRPPTKGGSAGAATPTIVILDGIGCSGWAFRRIIPYLSRRREVVMVHYRGHGASPTPPRPWRLGMDVLADDAAAVIERLDCGPILIVGFSMGFEVTIELVSRRPDLVAAVVNIAGPAGRALDQFQGTDAFGQVLPFLASAARSARRLSHDLWRRFVPHKIAKEIGLRTQVNTRRLTMDDFDLYMQQLAEVNPELFLTLLEHAHTYDGHEALGHFAVPTLVLAGEKDRFVPIEKLREVAFAIPGAQWQVLAEATHALPAEFPLEVAQFVERFADGVGQP